MAHILIAEDDHDTAELYARFLTTLGHTYQLASDGLTALAHFDTQAFDLVIADLQMPGINGLDLLRCVRNGTSRPRIIVCSALVNKIDGIALFGDRLMAKPLSLEDLGVAVTELLSRPARR
jgi:DNA-binding response OmpR family regulator